MGKSWNYIADVIGIYFDSLLKVAPWLIVGMVAGGIVAYIVF